MTVPQPPNPATPPAARLHRAIGESVWVRGLLWLEQHALLLLLGFFLLGGSAILLLSHYQSSKLVEAAALQSVRALNDALTEFRSLYTSEVVNPLALSGIEASHDYQHQPNSVPLPATLSMLIGKAISAKDSGVQVKLYSPYPFPWRQQEGGLRDQFAQDAWAAFAVDPQAPYYRTERINDRLYLRFATADRMREACVACHNRHAQSPKRGWQTGDVRGVLEIDRPLELTVGLARTFLNETLWLLLGLLLFAAACLRFVIGRLRASTAQAESLAKESVNTNIALQTEIVLKRRVQQSLHESQRQLHTLLSNLSGMVYRSRADANRSMEFVSDGALRLTGYTAETLLAGTPVFVDLIHPDERGKTGGQQQQAIAQQNAYQLTYRIVCADGAQKWVWDQGRGIYAEDGAVLAIEGFVTDISEKMLAEQAILKAKEEAELANRAKSLFLANMSQEIRTPLNAILGYGQILRRDGSLSPQHSVTVQTIENAGKHLLMLLNDVLEYARLESGVQEMQSLPFDLLTSLDRLARQFEPRCVQKGLVWWLAAPAAATLPVTGNHFRLQQILEKLLSNAVKFTERGQITLRVNPLDHQHYRFEVSDTGPGIDEAAKATLFQPFQLTELGALKGGAGLGLALCRRFVEQLGGQLDFESTTNHGSRFWFTLLLPTAIDTSISPAIDAGEPLPVLTLDRSVTALVVDDDADNGRILAEMLRQCAVAVRIAVDGTEALAVLRDQPREQPIDIIFMDIRLPGSDGFAVLAEIKRLYGESAPACVAVTASSLQKQSRDYRQAGFRDLICKPFRIETLYQCLQTVLAVKLVAQATSPGDVASGVTTLRLTQAQYDHLLKAIEQYWVSGILQGLDEIAAMGGEGPQLAAQGKALLARFDLNALRVLLKTLPTERPDAN